MKLLGNGALIALFVGFYAGLPTGVLMGEKVNINVAIVMGAFVGVGGVLFLSHRAARQAKESTDAAWRRRKERVSEVLVAELTKISSEFDRAGRLREVTRTAYTDQMAVLQKMIDDWEQNPTGHKYPECRVRQTFIPGFRLTYFEANLAALDCLPATLMADLSVASEVLSSLRKMADEEIFLQVAHGQLDRTYDLIGMVHARIRQLRDDTVAFRNILFAPEHALPVEGAGVAARA
jgi:hypothetical protein